MKKALSFFILIATLVSCSSDSNEIDNNNNSFFNINTGNKWVYKRYHHNSNTNEYFYSHHIDSVFVTGDTVINTLNYKKVMHKEYNDNNTFLSYIDTRFEYLRVDNNDHLVDQFGHVLHPGFDNQYQHVHQYPIYGSTTNEMLGEATFQLEAPQNILIEGANYLSYNYKGNFIGNTNFNIPNNTIHFMYSEQIGLVKQICPYASGFGFLEERLVYYDVN